LSKSRTHSVGARAAIAKLFDIPGFGEGWALVLNAFSETELRGCECAIGLIKPNPQFRVGIANGVFVALCFRAAPPKRASTVRSEFKTVAKQAAAAATSLQRLSAALDQTMLHDQLPEPLASLMAPPALHLLRGLAEIARQAADTLKGTPGRPLAMAFDVFIRQLADTFTRATGKPAGLTWSSYRNRYEGRFWNLIECVLPRTKTIVGDGFAPQDSIARGRQVQRILTAMDKTPAAES
jgi:hypothetical protein